MKTSNLRKKIVACCFVCLGFLAKGQKTDEELAKKLANPIAALISVPFQNNLDHGIGSLKGSRYVLNVQPVIPIQLSNKLNLITRWILPIMSQYNISGSGVGQSGIGDAVVSGFLSPVKPGSKITWGAGPVLLVPLGNNAGFSAKQFGLGPSFVALVQNGGWTYGGLINQIWSSGTKSSSTNISQMLINPFITYNWKSGAGITAAMEFTQNWISNQSSVYLIPMVSGLTSFGKQKISFGIGPKWNISGPVNQRSKFGLRASVALLFPK